MLGFGEEAAVAPSPMEAEAIAPEEPPPPADAEPSAPKAAASSERGDRRYAVTDLSAFAPQPDQFYEFGYRTTLKAMTDAVIEIESPLRTDILAQRIARAHGWLRMGGRIRERIDLHLRSFDRTEESSGEFIWMKGAVLEIAPTSFRQPVGAVRSSSAASC